MSSNRCTADRKHSRTFAVTRGPGPVKLFAAVPAHLPRQDPVNRLLRHCLVAVIAATVVAVLPVASASATTRGAERITYKFGPVNIASGQNTISLEPNHKGFPQVPGYITRFAPNLIRVSDHTIPRVDVLHLHHAVWLVNGYPQFAAGEEKTIAD